MLELNKIYNEDCLDCMKKIDNQSIDMILCDLPYGVTARNEWDVIIPFDKLWEQYNRITKENSAIVLFATEPFRTKLISSNMENFKYDLIWEKNKITGFLNSKKQPLRKHESILVFYKNQPKYNPQKTEGHKPVNAFTHSGNSGGTTYGKTKVGVVGGGQTDRFPTSILKFSVVNNDNKDKIHPSQKPVELLSYLIKTYTNENDLVLDNCSGSGSTGVAAILCKRNYILIEKNAKYFETSLNNINKAKL